MLSSYFSVVVIITKFKTAANIKLVEATGEE